MSSSTFRLGVFLLRLGYRANERTVADVDRQPPTPSPSGQWKNVRRVQTATPFVGKRPQRKPDLTFRVGYRRYHKLPNLLRRSPKLTLFRGVCEYYLALAGNSVRVQNALEVSTRPDKANFAKSLAMPSARRFAIATFLHGARGQIARRT